MSKVEPLFPHTLPKDTECGKATVCHFFKVKEAD